MWELEKKSVYLKKFRIAYTAIGPKDGRVLFCVHGLLSNGRDYDFLAVHLAEQGYRVISIDLPGRGRSDNFKLFWNYRATQYVPYIHHLIEHEIGDRPFDWLGVSLGGMLGIGLSSVPSVNMERLILVDVGAEISAASLNVISVIARQPTQFKSHEEAVMVLRGRCSQWGIHDEKIWNHLIKYNIIDSPFGGYKMHYDPKIGKAIPKRNKKVELWGEWKKIKQPVLLIRGAKSILLTKDLSDRMFAEYRGKIIQEMVHDDCGHVPNLMQDDHISQITRWLKS